MSSRCSICGSENTNKSSCPLNPEAPLHMCVTNAKTVAATPCPWKMEGLSGYRGNPLKHPLALDIMRKRLNEIQGYPKEYARAAVPGEQRPIGHGKEDKPIFHDHLRFFEGHYTDEGNPLYWLYPQERPKGSHPSGAAAGIVDFEEIKETAPELKSWAEPIYVGNYNLNGDLVYTSLKGMQVLDQKNLNLP